MTHTAVTSQYRSNAVNRPIAPKPNYLFIYSRYARSQSRLLQFEINERIKPDKSSAHARRLAAGINLWFFGLGANRLLILTSR